MNANIRIIKLTNAKPMVIPLLWTVMTTTVKTTISDRNHAEDVVYNKLVMMTLEGIAIHVWSSCNHDDAENNFDKKKLICILLRLWF